jgi:hypothetical protein
MIAEKKVKIGKVKKPSKWLLENHKSVSAPNAPKAPKKKKKLIIEEDELPAKADTVKEKVKKIESKIKAVAKTANADEIANLILINMPSPFKDLTDADKTGIAEIFKEIEDLIDNSLKAKTINKKEANALKGEKMIGFVNKILRK